MSKKKEPPSPESPRDWPFEKKLRVVYEALSLSDAELGEFLRREGLHEVQLREMYEAVEEALGRKKKPSKKDKSQAKKIKKLEKELLRKEKALAEVTALLVLKKKLDAYFLGDEDGATPKKNGK
jgi:transposase-like protein